MMPGDTFVPYLFVDFMCGPEKNGRLSFSKRKVKLIAVYYIANVGKIRELENIKLIFLVRVTHRNNKMYNAYIMDKSNIIITLKINTFDIRVIVYFLY